MNWWEDATASSALQNPTIMASSAGRLPPFSGESPLTPYSRLGLPVFPPVNIFFAVGEDPHENLYHEVCPIWWYHRG